TEECPISLKNLLIITEKEYQKDEEPILDLRSSSKAVKTRLTENSLAALILESLATDNIFTVFMKDSGLPIADTVKEDITAKHVNFTALLEYISLCHLLEKNPLLLDLDPEFLCVPESITKQIAFLTATAKDLITHADGIQILNIFGYETLCQDQ